VASTPLKNMKVSWGYYSQYYGKIKNVPKPPTSFGRSYNTDRWIMMDILLEDLSF